MSIDYDGINSFMNEKANRHEKQMISVLVEAMRDGSVTECPIEFCWEICDVCRGDGSHSNRLGVINPDDWDDEQMNDYASGRYDVVCEMCDGSGKVREIDESNLPADVQKFIEEYRYEYWQMIDIQRQEMMWGA